MLRFLTFAVSLTLAAAFVPGNALPHGAVVARASARPIMAIPERFRKGGNKVDKDLAPEDVYGDLSVDDAASEIEAVLGEKPKAKKADIKLPEVDLPEVDDVIVAAIKGSSTVMEKSKEALDAAIEFEKENDVSTKAKDAFAMAVDFWKQNEIGLKARAIGELIVEETSKMDIKVPSKPAKASKAPKAAAPKAAAKSKDVPKQAKSKRAKPAFEMPKFEMPKFEPPTKK